MRTFIPTDELAGKSPEEIEQILTDHQGKAEVLVDGMHLDMPESHVKSDIGLLLAGHIRPYVDFFGGKVTSGTDGTMFRNGVLLSPDVSVWSRERLYSATTAHHLYSEGTAPKLVMECEWWHERNRAFAKKEHYYFDPACAGLRDVNGYPTNVEEVWIFILHREREIVPSQNRSRVQCWWGYVPIVHEALTSAVSRLIEMIYSLQGEPDLTPGGVWGGLWILLAMFARLLCWLLLDVVHGEPVPPTDPFAPYLAVFVRIDHDPIYYHLKPNQMFLAPWHLYDETSQNQSRVGRLTMIAVDASVYCSTHLYMDALYVIKSTFCYKPISTARVRCRRPPSTPILLPSAQAYIWTDASHTAA